MTRPFSRLAFPDFLANPVGQVGEGLLDQTSEPARDAPLRFAAQWEHEFPGLESGVFIAIGSLLRLAQMLDNEFRDYTQSQFGMGIGDMRILLAMRRAGSDRTFRPTDLFKSLLISSGAVTKQVDRLSARGLVVRVSAPNRKGGWRIRLTDSGREAADAALHAIYNTFIVSKAFRTMTPTEKQAGNLFLSRIIAHYESAGADEVAENETATLGETRAEAFP